MSKLLTNLFYDICVGLVVVASGLVVAVYLIEFYDNYFDVRMCGEMRSVIAINKDYAITKWTSATCNHAGVILNAPIVGPK